MEAEEGINVKGHLGKSASDAFHQHRTAVTKDALSLGSEALWLLGLEHG